MRFPRDGFQASPRRAEALSALLATRLDEDLFGNGLAAPLPEDQRRQLLMSGHVRTRQSPDEDPSVPPAPYPQQDGSDSVSALPNLAEAEELMREMAAQPRDLGDAPDAGPSAESNLWDD